LKKKKTVYEGTDGGIKQKYREKEIQREEIGNPEK